MTGYVRVDTSNNISDGNVIAAADLDNEFDGVQAGFNASTGHTHGGAAGEGAPITKIGPTQDVTASASLLAPKTTNTVDVGSSLLKFKDLWLSGNASVAGTLGVTGVATLTAQPILSSLTASRAVFTDASKGLVSNAITGTGNVVMSASPTLTGTINAEALTLSGTVTATGGTANGVTYLNGSKVLTTGSALTFDGTNFQIGNASALSAASGRTDLTINGSSIGAIISFGNGGVRKGYIWQDGTDLYVANQPNGSAIFITNNSEQMRLTSTGLGIGTSSPALQLEVNGSGRIRMATSTLTSGFDIGWLGGSTVPDAYVWNRQNGPMLFGTNNAERMRLDSSGNLGLGVTPSAWDTFKAFDVNTYASLFASTGSAQLSGNLYYAGGSYKYKTTAAGSIYVQTTGQHQWYNAPSGTTGANATITQAMTLDASGNLGLGVTPSAWSATSYKTFEIGSIGNAINSGTNDVLITANAYFNSGWKYGSSGSQASFYNQNAGTHIWKTAASGTAGNAISFTQAMTLDASGNLLVGVTATVANAAFVASKSVTDYVARFINSNSSGYGVVVNYSGASPNSTGQEFLRCVDSTTDRMTVRSNGGIANFSANNVNLSDERTKKDIENAGDYLSKICAIPVRTFKYKDQTDELLNLGVIAQEVEAVAPELVDVSGFGETPEDGVPLKAIYQTDLQYALMKCIQEQQALIQSLQADVAALKAAA